MRYVISAVRKTTMPKRDGGTWQKTEVKTDQTGEMILEVGRGVEKYIKDNLKKGDVLNGYIEKRPWTGKDNVVRYNQVLNGITAEYVYELLLRINPDAERMASETETPNATIETPSDDGFGNSSGLAEGDGNDW